MKKRKYTIKARSRLNGMLAAEDEDNGDWIVLEPLGFEPELGEVLTGFTAVHGSQAVTGSAGRSYSLYVQALGCSKASALALLP